VRRKAGWFDSGGGRNPDALYLIGPHAELVGQRVERLPVLPRRADDAPARFDQATDLDDVDPASGFVPGEITGRIPAGRPGGGRVVALSLNGTIAATGRTFSLDNSPHVEHFEMIVPESGFRRGPNEAALFEIVSRDGAVTLRRLSGD
jgi:hypothetical protein